jgi:hypothetical protein
MTIALIVLAVLLAICLGFIGHIIWCLMHIMDGF